VFYEGISVEFERKSNPTLVFLLSNFPQVQKTTFITNPLNIILTILVYDYSNIGLSLVVYVYHNGIISLVLCGYDVQTNM